MPRVYRRRPNDMSIEDHFWSLVKQGEPNECWPWDGHFSGDYGQYRRRGAHIQAWEFTHESAVPRGLFVCHDCDNPICCNPKHLWVGTCQQNVADMNRKARHPHLGRPRIADDEQIRTLYASGLTQQKVADQLGISQALVSVVVRGVRGH